MTQNILNFTMGGHSLENDNISSPTSMLIPNDKFFPQ
jgi:hypothetical protein